MNSLQGEEGRGGGEEETLNGLMIQLTKLWCQSFFRAMSDGFTTIAYEHTKGYTYLYARIRDCTLLSLMCTLGTTTHSLSTVYV